MAGHDSTGTHSPAVLPDIPGQTEPEKIAQSIVPYARDDSRARYLGLRSSGFTIREALRLIGNAHSTLSLWRKDEEFVSLEARIPEFRKQLSLEYANLEFVRNYRLILEKDYRVIHQSIYPQKDGEGKSLPMSDQDHAYLIKMRSHYTPQQLQIIETLIQAESTGTFDFTDFVITAARIEQRVRIEGKGAKVSELPRLQEANEDNS